MCHRPDISTIYRSKTDISAIYRSSPISCRTSLILDISEIYRRIYRIFSSLLMTPRRRVDVPDYGEALAPLQQHIVALTTTINNMHVKRAPPTHADIPSDEEDVPANNQFALLQPAHPHHAAPLAIPRPDCTADDT